MTDQMQATQRPFANAAFVAPSGEPAWKTIPSWYMVASKDRAIDPDGERAMAARMGAHTVQVSSSHAVLVSHAAAVTALITTAARAVG
jgi:pimeloyl-ACP methyl ester carboxylesterase